MSFNRCPEMIAIREFLMQPTRPTPALDKAAVERDEAHEALREIAMLTGNPDPSDGEGTTPAEVVSMVNGALDKAREFLRDCRDNFDCDKDAHGYNTTCRACEAREILALLEKEGVNGPLTVREAQRLNVCRICKANDAASPGNPLVLNYGDEYAHEQCLAKASP